MTAGSALRVGVAGLSPQHGRPNRVAAAIAAGMAPVALADLDPPLRRTAADVVTAEGLPAPALYASVDEMLCDDAVDAVVLSIPTRLHALWALEALGRGKHVFVDKPVATSLAEATRMVAAAGIAGRRLAVGYQKPFAAAEAIDVVRSGRIGTPLSASASWVRPVGEMPSSPAFRSQPLGHGAAVDLGSHQISLLMALVRTRPRLVTTSASRTLGAALHGASFHADDRATTQIRFDDGFTFTGEVRWGTWTEQERSSFVVEGTSGSVSFGIAGPETDTAPLRPRVVTASGTQLLSPPPTNWRANVAALERFAGLCASGETGDGEEILAVQAILDAMQMSAAQCGRQVDVPGLRHVRQLALV